MPTLQPHAGEMTFVCLSKGDVAVIQIRKVVGKMCRKVNCSKLGAAIDK
jgi:hypothetical protein